MSNHLTTDPADPRLLHGADTEPVPQAEAYLVLSEEERAMGFVRPVRRSYRHVGPDGPLYALRDLSDEEQARHSGVGYVKYETYPDGVSIVGRYWTQAKLDAASKGGCGTVTTMGDALSETYARNPKFYGATYCVVCRMHRPVGEFVWDADGAVVGS
jgi:hypothetical protein